MVDRSVAVSTSTGKASEATCCRVGIEMTVKERQILVVGMGDVSDLKGARAGGGGTPAALLTRARRGCADGPDVRGFGGTMQAWCCL